jgi:tetratricopeptide (TPR) repeat protein
MMAVPETPDAAGPTAEALRDGIAAARAGQRELARKLLTQVVEHDERNLPAWLWLSGVVDNLEEREICLQNVLTLDPKNRPAIQGMEEVRLQKEAQAAAPPPAAAAVPLAGPPQAAPSSLSLDDEYLCPYCAAPTRPADRKCPACSSPLWTTSRQQEQQRASKMGLAVGLQAACTLLNIVGLGVLLGYTSAKLGAGDWFILLKGYLGMPGVPPDLTEAALQVTPRLTVLALIFFFVFSLVVLVGMCLRWKLAFFLFLINGAWLGVAGTLVTRLLWEVGSWGGEVSMLVTRIALVLVDVSVVLVVFALALEIRDDFFFDRQRILLKLDRGTVAGMDFMAHGQRHLRNRMWALAAIHLKRAVDQMPNDIAANLQLALAYGHLERDELAGRYLAEARRIAPQDPRVAELAQWLQQRHAAVTT